MQPEAMARHMPLPAGIHRDTGEVLSLAQTQADPTAVADPTSLSDAQKIALVGARWRAGEWSDILYGDEGLVDLDRALRELEAQTEIGRHLMAVELRALEMVHEDAAREGR